MIEVTILSYNLWFNKAFAELDELVRKHNVDILCLQECRVESLPREVGNLQLIRADLLYKDIGLALFANATKWTQGNTGCYDLPRTTYEKLLTEGGRPRLQLCRFTNKMNGSEVVAGNVHIANLLSSGAGRRRQAARAAELSLDFSQQTPLVLAGDFNHPFGLQKLDGVVVENGLYAVENTRPTYQQWPRRTFDRMFASQLETKHFQVLPFGASDHAPIMGRFQA